MTGSDTKLKHFIIRTQRLELAHKHAAQRTYQRRQVGNMLYGGTQGWYYFPVYFPLYFPMFHSHVFPGFIYQYFIKYVRNLFSHVFSFVLYIYYIYYIYRGLGKKPGKVGKLEQFFLFFFKTLENPGKNTGKKFRTWECNFYMDFA